MKFTILGLITAFSMLLSGCAPETNSCTTGDPECINASFPYSCPAAVNCYTTESSCASSGECP